MGRDGMTAATALLAAVLLVTLTGPARAASPFAPPTPEPASEPPADSPADTQGQGEGEGEAGETVAEHTFKEPPAEVRAVRGRFTPPDRVKDAYLVERMLNVTVPVPVDKETGRFEVTGLAMGTYCFVVRTPWGRLEGVDLTPRLSPYDALIPPRYRTEAIGLPARGEFTEEDRKAVRRIIHKVKRYENKVTDLAISADGETAVALVELLMDAPFVGRKGQEVTWRIEKWYYDKLYDAWNTFRSQCLYRIRAPKAEWQSWGWQFEPKLGGLDITYGMDGPVEVEYAIPAEPSRAKGLAGTTYPPADKAKTW